VGRNAAESRRVPFVREGLAGPANRQPASYEDNSLNRVWLPIFHVTLLGALRLRRGLPWFHTPAGISTILQSTEKSRAIARALLWLGW
jgi:hypothetical protein